MVTLPELIAKSPRGSSRDRIIAFDPGETTGVACIQDDQFMWSKQLDTKTIPGAHSVIHQFLKEQAFPAAIIVHEIYRVFKWHVNDHAWASLHTPRLIGGLEATCEILGLPLHGQTPQVAKNFATDANLRAWDLYHAGTPHARDALRHAIHFALFGDKAT